MLRSEQEVEEARTVVCHNMGKHKIASTEMALLAGASVALQWMMHDEKGPGTLSALIEEYRNAVSDV